MMRKESDASTLLDGRKQSIDTNSMTFVNDEEMKENLMMDQLNESRDSLMKDNRKAVSHSPSQGGLIIDLQTLKKLLNRQSCDFILSLI
jgi:hypothetical protein